MSRGYNGKMLWVNLSNGEILVQKWDEELGRRFLGGAGLAAKLIWDYTNAKTAPLSADNPLIFMTGPVTATRFPTSGRYVISSLSPLTNIWGQSHAGGTWGYALKLAGLDGVVVKGIANRPVYLWIDGNTAELRDANHLWGGDNWATDEKLKAELGKEVSVASIGQAGEKLVRFASIVSNGRMARIAAGSGLGAVMGSKRLKAIAVRGNNKRPEVYDDQGLKASIAANYVRERTNPEELRQRFAPLLYKLGDGVHSIKNYQIGEFEGFHEKYVESFLSGVNMLCMGCSVGCRQAQSIGDRRRTASPHTVCLGARCMIKDLDVLQKTYDLCNQYGMDSISTGGVIAFGMELYEKGIITKDDTGGIDLAWGNSEALLTMVEQIGHREGFGRLLGEGVRIAAEHIGGLASEYSMHVKGQELPPHDVRAWNAGALEFATSSRGAHHMEADTIVLRSASFLGGDLGKIASDPFAVEGTGRLVAKAQDYAGMFDSLVACKKLLGSTNTRQVVPPEIVLEWFNYVTGWQMSMQDFMKAGERIFNLKRMINVRRGISRKDDTLPSRLLTSKRYPTDNLPPLGVMLNEYYIHRGWSEEGIPTKKILAELDLPELVE